MSRSREKTRVAKVIYIQQGKPQRFVSKPMHSKLKSPNFVYQKKAPNISPKLYNIKQIKIFRRFKYSPLDSGLPSSITAHRGNGTNVLCLLPLASLCVITAWEDALQSTRSLGMCSKHTLREHAFLRKYCEVVSFIKARIVSKEK